MQPINIEEQAPAPMTAPKLFLSLAELSDLTGEPAYNLRWLEKKFSAVRPVRFSRQSRHYRPRDVALVRGIVHLLRIERYTAAGVQRILSLRGLDYVVALGAFQEPPQVAA